MKNILIACFVLVLTACSSPTPNFYQPVAILPDSTTYPEFKGSLLVNQVILPAENTRQQITTLGSENYQIHIDEYNRWGASPERLIQRALNEDLSKLLPNAMVESQTPLRKNFQYAVAYEITDMSGRLKENARLQAVYFIKNKMGNVIKSGHFDKSIPVTGGYDAYVVALSKLFGELAATSAIDIAKLR